MYVAGSPVYHSRLAHWLSGPLDVDSLNRSLDEIARRHEVLRTRYEDGGDGPVQVLLPEARLSVTVTDISGLPEADREARALELARLAAVRPFDLRTGPPVRAELIRLGERDHLLVVAFHHIVVDGWSAGVFERELGALYGACAAGETSPLPELPLTYLDYAAWQRVQPPDPGLERRLDYWRARLADPPVLELAADRPRPRVPTLRAGLESRTLPADAAAALRALARRERATPAMAILAALASLLARRTGQSDVMIGMAVANRDLAECEDLIGYLTNLLVLRTDVSGTPTFRELIGRMRETCLDAYANDVPFEKLVESLQPERKHSGNPLTDVQVSFVPPRAPLEMAGLSCRPAGIEAPTHTGQPITLYVTDAPDGSGSGTRLDLLYHSDLFTAAQMAALADQLEHLLAAATAAPDAPAGGVSLVTPAARRVLPDLSAGLDRPR
jgi:hypothetical protein